MKPRKLTENELSNIVAREAEGAVGWYDSELSGQRIENMDYYQGEPFGTEREGRSAVVLTEVADGVEFVMPSFMRIFASTDETWRFAPRGPEDGQAADQATEYVNYILNVDNDGFTILHNAIKDGLLQKNGVVKVWWDESEDVTEEEYEGLTLEELAILTSDPEVTLVSRSEMPEEPGETDEPMMPGTVDVKIKRTKKVGRCVVENIPPEDFLISKRATSLETARFAGHRTTKTVSDLIAMGHDRAVIEEHLGADDKQDNEKDVRFRDVDDGDFSESADPSMREVTVTEAYVRADYDGDGIAELRRVLCIGSGYKILENEAFDHKPFAMWSPIMMPHRAIGRAYAELLKDIQEIKSMIMRQILDSFYLVTNPRPVVGRGVNMDDLLATAPGRPIRAEDPNAVVWQKGTGLGGEGFPLLEYMDAVREQRTGINKASMGLASDTLQNTTATAVAAQMAAAQGRIELMARVFANTFMRQLAKLILRVVTMYQKKERVIRLRNQWVPVDPRMWKNEYDIVINVGLGTGQVAERLAMLGQIAAKQELIIGRLGPNNPIVPASKYVYTLRRMAETAGFRDTDRFFADLPDGQPIEIPQQSDGVAEAKMAEAQGKLQIHGMAAQGKLQIEAQKAATKAQQDAQKMQMDFFLRMKELMSEFELRQREMVVDAAVGIDKNRVSTNLPRPN